MGGAPFKQKVFEEVGKTVLANLLVAATVVEPEANGGGFTTALGGGDDMQAVVKVGGLYHGVRAKLFMRGWRNAREL